MAQVIAVAQQKGGAGKTMLATQLGVALGMTRRVGLLDIDPQGSLGAWARLRAANAKARADLAVESVSGWRLANTLDAMRRDCDLLVIDTPPVLDSDARRAIRGADLVLVPLNPSPPDLWAAEGTLTLAAEERRPVALVFNRAPAASKLRRRLEAEIAARRLRLIDEALGNRAAYANSFAEGLGVAETGPSTLAGTEIAALATRLASILE
ncbi:MULTISPECIES: ParA family partition ATPase [Acidiphilium]|uniref:Putative partitioning protein n=1 Tax=Acidiphilium multivorum (strain DSM 11245 / JCM 8867 / NBRC 100883 / AIU 301) TaxID=926570 RepID=F0J136_ACIMA|nr:MULTISPECIES: ParA family partition ATPase [Acidiphilium]MBU6357136.1 ParA family protein [Rhodospirillales bacterium]EGO93525.1 Cobyrinic acid a,c-diamide synthase [Acidiphilium sp. PM]KDM68595.1 cobyrinic acid a,c-diamide synthase [Acidiphilium sp. JA12-A1]MBS3023993.1 ParA family protein [Acidiphilium multivorum]MDE2328043.1 ParA family protein [Rhodospirillales bacterium]